LHELLNQDYPNFEIIAMDDFSNDHAFDELKLVRDHRLKIFKATKNLLGKKLALTEAIQQSNSEFLLLTDADCKPSSNQWIKSMVVAMMSNTKAEMVLGYGPMNPSSSLINKFSRFDTFITAMQYFTYALFRIPYMGVGRNIMYSKSLFQKLGGFTNHQHIISGDDDLFVSAITDPKQVDINLDRNSFVYSNSKTNLPDFLRQKSRHITTSLHYKWVHKSLLGLFALSQIGFYTCILLVVLNGAISLPLAFCILILKWTLQMLLQNEFLKTLNIDDLRWWFPVLDLLMFVYLVTISIYGIFSKPKW
jgi:cellulose synthase/poly-beta-1,6-N-acetylglucosamine synthase-like glycosyltransferase